MKKLLTLLFALIAMASTAFADPDAVPDYLCFEVTEGTTVSLKKVGKANPNIQYSFNKTTWNDFTELTVRKDCRIYFRGVNPNGFSTSHDDYSSFSISSYNPEFRCSGNVMSLIDGVGETTVIPSSYCFFRLFNGCRLTTAPKLPATTLTEYCYEQMFYDAWFTTVPELPATTMVQGCYSGMFSGCRRLTQAPKLPATTLAEHCYYGMFSDCTNLTDAPKLPVTTLAEHCYEQMFYGCERLTQAPKLPATTLSSNCYYQMFSGCTSLTQAPKLPATTLSSNCYYQMFSGCTSLTDAPELPATTLAEHCYEQMFSRCRSLTDAPELPATTLAEHCYYQMFYGCRSLTQAPNLPATTLAEYCYCGMFSDCTSLTDAPELPATTLEGWCYDQMFYGCTSLTDAPKLPATTLARSCYAAMFYGCTSLTDAPELPATTLEDWCYSGMFSGCTSLTTAPELPATTLAKKCYYAMFRNCTNLTTAPELPAAIIWDKLDCYIEMFSGCEQLNSICVNFNKWPTRTWVTDPDGNINWVANVSETGTFVCPNNLEIKYGDCYIPKGWTVITKEPVTYTILCTDANITADKTTATIDDKVNLTIKDRTSEGYKLDKVLVNSTEIAVQDFRASFEMKDYLTNVTITVQYSKNSYTISTDDFSQVANSTANMGDVVNVTFKQREGYNLTSATFNGKALTVNNYASSFSMPAANVEIKTQYSKNSYTITTDDFSQVANTTANMGDVVNVTFKQREGYNLTSATFNGKALTVNNYASSFSMPAANVEIKTQYSKNSYTISTDDFSQVANTTANVDDAINVTFKQRDGYNLTSATYNGTALAVSNYKSSFTMPAANVEIKTVYAPIAYAISCTDANITADKTTATIEDKVNLTIKDRTSEGYKLDKVLMNSTEIAVRDFKASFDMKDYLKDVTISAQYSQIAYTITTDEYSQVANSTATVDDAITVTFKQREGFDLVSATYNGNPLNINNYKASFTMPAQNVEIKTVYAEKEYEIAKPSEDVQISQPTAKAGDEINITVTIKDGYTAHLYVNGQEVALNGNLANYIMPSGRIEIKVEYVANPKTPVSEIYLYNCAVSVFPNPAKSGEKITLKVGGKFDTNNTKIYIYNASGSLVMQIDDVQEYNQLTLRSGIYIGVLVAKGGKKTFRVAVE